MKLKKILSLILSCIMVFSLTACSNSTSSSTETTTTQSTSSLDTLVIASDELNGIFNPFFYSSGADMKAFDPVFDTILDLDDNNELIPGAGEITFEEIKDEDGNITQVEYTIKLQEGIQFSDGEDVTIDDVIFTYYVLSDPNYDGINTFKTLDIVGLNEYIYDMEDYSSKLDELLETAQNITDEQIQEYVESVVDADIEENTTAVLNESLALGIDTSSVNFDNEVREAYIQYLLQDENIKEDAIDNLFETLKKELIQSNLEGGANVTEISGIQKVDDYTCTVLINGVNIDAERLLGDVCIMPEHYYGVADDGTVYTKGDLSVPKSRNSSPLGSGPYIFEKYENNIVSLKANPNYYKGEPLTPNIKIQVVSTNSKLDVVLNGDVDISEPSASKEIMARVEENGLDYNLTDNNGYGYIGINADRITDINVRKGLMCLISREAAINSYYGDLAVVLERPMTSTLAEYPEDATAYYTYDKEKALEYFTLAGYSQDSSGKLVNENGEQLKIEVGVADLSSHPCAAILSQMKTDLTEMGAEFIISDLQGNVLFDRMESGDLDMFVAAWGSSNSADLTQIFHSNAADGAGSNHFKLRDPEVDALLEQVSQTLDLEERKELVAQELDLIMENAVIMPIYQRKNLTVFNSDNINMDTVYTSDSPYHTFRDELYLLEMK